MPKPATATNKTEFQRYLDENPKAAPSLRARQRQYADLPRSKKVFGFWVRMFHRPDFDVAYNRYWLRHSELHGQVYEQVLDAE